MVCMKLRIYAVVLVWLMVVFTVPICNGYTDPRDVSAINSLYAALGYPLLPGWLPAGGDPCVEAWLGVQCVESNITGVVLNGLNLGGELGNNLDSFASIMSLDLSNNHIGGSIPSNLPLTLRKFFLSGNQFSGSIPDNLSSLTQLSDILLNSNHLTGGIPDAFQTLTSLINLDLSSNNLSDPLPASFGNLSTLTTLYLQNNQLSGTLDVLQDLPLRDLNIENNQFSGPIPVKLLSIPNFRKDGNPFNTTIIPSPPTSAPSPSPLGVQPPKKANDKQANGPSASYFSREKSSSASTSIIWTSVAGVLICIIIALGLWFLMSRCCKDRLVDDKTVKRHEMGACMGPMEKSKSNESYVQPANQLGKVSREAMVKARGGVDYRKGSLSSNAQEPGANVRRMSAISDCHQIDMKITEANSTATFYLPVEKVVVKPIAPNEISLRKFSTKRLNSCGVNVFTIASLQQYTNSFSQENHIGGDILGSVYRAELPDGKLVAVKKLDPVATRQHTSEEFLELVSNISKLQHQNILKLLGYCIEHEQRLLVYEYCKNGALHDVLDMDDDIHIKLSWDARILVALGAARGLEYMHERCQPPVVHRHFTSGNVLLDDELAVCISDCGLAPIISSGSLSQLSGQILAAYGYSSPEFESGNYTYQSDIFSFGVVLLELLTGRKPYDRSRPRGEQFLVRWAFSKLHDINALAKMVDPFLNGAYPPKSLSRFADIISLCIQPEPEFRPPMSEIVQNLLQMIQG